MMNNSNDERQELQVSTSIRHHLYNAFLFVTALFVSAVFAI